MSKHNKNYNTDVKQNWRIQVWDYYRELSGKHKIPREKQYWTLGDRTIDSSGNPTGELKAITDYGLLEDLGSFVSVNNEEEKVLDNIPHCKKCGLSVSNHTKESDHRYEYSQPWITLYGDIAKLIMLTSTKGRFYPSFINLDTTHFPNKVLKLAKKISRYCHPGCFMAVNIVDNFMSRASNVEDFQQFRQIPYTRLHEPKIYYSNGNCDLSTIFLEFV